MVHWSWILSWNKFCEQVEGVAMGSLVSPMVASLYMDNFEKKVLNTMSTPLDFGWDM